MVFARTLKSQWRSSSGVWTRGYLFQSAEKKWPTIFYHVGQCCPLPFYQQFIFFRIFFRTVYIYLFFILGSYLCCLGITHGGLGIPYGVLRIEPGSAVYKARALPALSLQSSSVWILFVFVWGSYLAVIRASSWHRAQGLFLPYSMGATCGAWGQTQVGYIKGKNLTPVQSQVPQADIVVSNINW